MRNSVKIIDPISVNLTIDDIEPGQLFKFKNSTGDSSVYMKLEGEKKKAVHLPTGQVFEMSDNASLIKVWLVQIGSGS